jgi:hypothetical protein
MKYQIPVSLQISVFINAEVKSQNNLLKLKEISNTNLAVGSFFYAACKKVELTDILQLKMAKRAAKTFRQQTEDDR